MPHFRSSERWKAAGIVATVANLRRTSARKASPGCHILARSARNIALLSLSVRYAIFRRAESPADRSCSFINCLIIQFEMVFRLASEEGDSLLSLQLPGAARDMRT